MAYDFNPDILMGGHPPVLPDPLHYATQAMTLANLSDASALRRMQVEQQKRAQAAQDAVNRVLPDVLANNWSEDAIRRAVQQEPSSAGVLLDALDKKRASDAALGKTQAETAKDQATAKMTLLKPIADMAFKMSQDPNLSPQMIRQWHGIVASNGLGGLIPTVPMQAWTNPESARQVLQVAGSAFYAAHEQMQNAETGRHNLATEGAQAGNYASEAVRREAETSQGWARLKQEKELSNKLQHVTLPDGSVYAFNPQSGGFIQGKNELGTPIVGTKPLTETQSNATAYGMRMKDSSDIIDKLEQSGFDTGAPMNLLAYNRLTNFKASPKAQELYAAKLNFMTASLRKESGAAISPSEFTSEDKKYFPQPGDDVETRAQKKAARELAIRAMAVQAGPVGAKQFNVTQPTITPLD